jgi:hypothetical protein
LTFRKAIVWLTILKNLGINLHRLNNYSHTQFLNDRETLLWLKEKKTGITRFGDGELSYLSGYSFSHQKQEPVLRKKLKKILTTYNHKSPFLLALPYDICFNEHQKRNLPKNVWNSAKYSLLPYIKRKHVYGSAFCFRILTVLDEDKYEYSKILLQLFRDKEILYVGSGEPFAGLISSRCFIKTQPTNAFDEYNFLLDKIKKNFKELKNPCVILSCGITATALSADLNNMGILSYDVGLCFTRRLAPFTNSEGMFQSTTESK